ncbi:MAG: hypothetical protein ACRC0G_10480 [Fusobacteriaceae bacterium]
MAGFNNFNLTNAGVELLNRVIAEKKTLVFTKFEIGNGKNLNVKESVGLSEKFLEFEVTESSSLPNGFTNVKGFFDNKNINFEKRLSEIGVYANIDGDVSTEVLFSYTTAVGEGEMIPSFSNSHFSRVISIFNKTGDVENVSFNAVLDKNKYDFNTIAELQSASYLDVGDKVNVWGDKFLGDNKKISKTITKEPGGVQLKNGLFAKKHSEFLEDGGFGGTAADLKKEIDILYSYVSVETIGKSSLGSDYAGDFYLGK